MLWAFLRSHAQHLYRDRCIESLAARRLIHQQRQSAPMEGHVCLCGKLVVQHSSLVVRLYTNGSDLQRSCTLRLTPDAVSGRAMMKDEAFRKIYGFPYARPTEVFSVKTEFAAFFFFGTYVHTSLLCFWCVCRIADLGWVSVCGFFFVFGVCVWIWFGLRCVHSNLPNMGVDTRFAKTLLVLARLLAAISKFLRKTSAQG